MKRIGTVLRVLLLLLLTAISLWIGFSGGLAGRLAAENAELDAAAALKNTGIRLGPLSLLPPVVAIALAILTHEVLTALLAGIITGEVMRFLLLGKGGLLNGLSSVFNSTVDGIITVVSDRFNSSVILLCLMIGGLVALIRSAGGFLALAERLSRRIRSARGAQLTAQLLGLMLFFDDYANALIVGPVMSPITDRQGVSREKLAHIVDSTAAPVAGIAVISSWISAELAAIESGLAIAGVQASAYSMFLGSIPFCFYNLFALILLFFSILLQREYGPMLRAERRARAGQPVKPAGRDTGATGAIFGADSDGAKPGSVLSAIVPVVLLCLAAVIGFYLDGRAAAVDNGLLAPDAPLSMQTIAIAFSAADTITILVRATLIASAVALCFGILTRAFRFVKGVEIWVSGASGLLVTGIILCLAWSLSGVVSQLGTAYYLVELVTLHLPYWCIPALIFITCCAISFATGSYGCMLIVMPMAVPVAYASAGLTAAALPHPEGFLSACIAGVLSGAIFGDHCSPITDTTILSSIGAGCGNIDHVHTQLPYALTAALIAAGAMLLSGLGVPAWVCLLSGSVLSVGALLLLGKKPAAPTLQPTGKENRT